MQDLAGDRVAGYDDVEEEEEEVSEVWYGRPAEEGGGDGDDLWL